MPQTYTKRALLELEDKNTETLSEQQWYFHSNNHIP